MSVELLYTSAPNGLKQGSRGFCTVLSTQGMPVNLASRLELLSGYRHIFPPQDPQANQNPVAWSHVTLSIGGHSTSILSRIAAHGVDYSGRTNKLAHHVVVGMNERISAGPVWLLQTPGLMRSDWDGVCATPAIGPPIAQANQTAKVCETWRTFTGDAGWGGVVAEAFAAPAGKPLWVIYRLEQQRALLTLVNEAIALLPEAKRWQATFSTYYTNLPPEVDCKVRFVVEGTEEAIKLASRGSSIVLAPGAALTSTSPFVESARTGVAKTVSVARPAVVIETGLNDPVIDTPLRMQKVLPPTSFGAHGAETPPAITMPPRMKRGAPPLLSSKSRKPSKLQIAAMIGVPILILLLCTAGYAWYRSLETKVAKGTEKTLKILSDKTQSASDGNDPMRNNSADAQVEEPEFSDVGTSDTEVDPPQSGLANPPTPPAGVESNSELGPGSSAAPHTEEAKSEMANEPQSTAGPEQNMDSAGRPSGGKSVDATSPANLGETPKLQPSLKDSVAPIATTHANIKSEPDNRVIAVLDLNNSIDAKKTFASLKIKGRKLREIDSIRYAFTKPIDNGAISIGNTMSLVKLDEVPLGLSKEQFEKQVKKPSVKLTVGKNSELTLVFDEEQEEVFGWLVIHHVSITQNKELDIFKKALDDLSLEKNALLEKLKDKKDVFVEGLNIDLSVPATVYAKTETDLMNGFEAHRQRIAERLDVLNAELKDAKPDKDRRVLLDAEKKKLDHSLAFFKDIEKKMQRIASHLQVLRKGAVLTIGELEVYPKSGDIGTPGLRGKPAVMDKIDLTVKLQLVEKP